MARRALAVALATSLAVNMFLIGGIAGAAIMWQRAEAQRPLGGIGGPGRLREAAVVLAPANRRALRREVRAALQELRPQVEKARAARIEAGRLLLQPELDRAALERTMTEAREADQAIRRRLEGAVVEAVAQLPLAEREKLVAAFDRRGAVRRAAGGGAGNSPARDGTAPAAR